MDFLPKFMCFFCNYKLAEFYKFYNKCLQADEELKSQLSWMSPQSADEAKKTEHLPMVEIKKYKIQDGLDFNVDKDRHDTARKEKELNLINNLSYSNDSLTTGDTKCTHHHLNLNHDDINMKLSSSKKMTSQWRLFSENHVQKNNSSSNSVIRKLRSNRSKKSPHISVKTSAIGSSNSKINAMWDSKLLRGVEVKVEKINVDKPELFRNPCHRNQSHISKTREPKNCNGNFVKWRVCKRKCMNT
ncbi:uncharacterized protein LOC135166391 isoform X2 [Diachasmimorpha longicaudata]